MEWGKNRESVVCGLKFETQNPGLKSRYGGEYL